MHRQYVDYHHHVGYYHHNWYHLNHNCSRILINEKTELSKSYHPCFSLFLEEHQVDYRHTPSHHPDDHYNHYQVEQFLHSLALINNTTVKQC